MSQITLTQDMIHENVRRFQLGCKLIVIIHCLETLVQMMWSCVCVTKQHN